MYSLTILQDILRNRGRTYAVLNYEGVDEYSVPTIRHRDCTPSVPCTAVNQLYRYLLYALQNITC